MFTVLLGGARSGKSQRALRMGHAHLGPVTFIATSPHIDGDDELDARITIHRAERPATWHTIEEQLDLAAAIEAAGDHMVIIDCLTVWVGNRLHRGDDQTAVLAASQAALEQIAARGAPTVALSNEVGLGIVPDNQLARSYRDVLGRVNQAWVAAADRAGLIVAGRVLRLDEQFDQPR